MLRIDIIQTVLILGCLCWLLLLSAIFYDYIKTREERL
jgi:hypothetical protein